ncbi:MAG: hypothetical protein NDJ92_00740 [Thermoanaerobaculia bacterium]|nr:hypothetical protein [Thermoanaerobaculia bacterium]
MRLRTLLSLFIAICAPAVFAQTITIGNVYTPQTGFAIGPVDGITFVDLVHPATASGALVQASFAYPCWAEECPGAAKIKFFRQVGSNLRMIAERGPFNAPLTDNQIFELSPPVQVLEGDLIGVAEMVSKADCGGSFQLAPPSEGRYLAFSNDVMGEVRMSAGKYATGTLVVSASGTPGSEYAARIMPVVGSAAGGYGSQWSTSVQLLNPNSVATTGKLVFRSAGVPASSSDPSIPYSLEPGATETIPDIAAAFGRGGLGSLDVVTRYGDGVPPVVVAYIFSAHDDGGVFGMTEYAVDLTERSSQYPTSTGTRIGSWVLDDAVTGYLIAPRSATESRFNIGVRTLAPGASITATLRSSTGAPVLTVTREFPPDYFQQFSAGEFFGMSLAGGESIVLTVVRGSAIVYGCAVDNLTNDPAIFYAYGVTP